VQKAAAAAVDPADRPFARRQVVRLVADVIVAAVAPDADERRVLAKNEHSPRPIAADLVNEPPLTPEHVFKIDGPEQVNLQRRFDGGSWGTRHLLTVPAAAGAGQVEMKSGPGSPAIGVPLATAAAFSALLRLDKT
jgi:hypothetical protein